MSFVQKLFTRFVSPATAASMEAESRAWMIRCPCGYEQSVWDRGGIRWKAAGNQKVRGRCPQCGQVTWQTIYKRDTPAASQ